MSEFTCELCHETFNELLNDKWNDFHEAKEMLELMPNCKNHPTGIVCEDCYKIFLNWFNQLTDEEKKAIENEPY